MFTKMRCVLLLHLVYLYDASLYSRKIASNEGLHLDKSNKANALTACLLYCDSPMVSFDKVLHKCICYKAIYSTWKSTRSDQLNGTKIWKRQASLLSENKPSSQSSSFFGHKSLSKFAFDGNLSQNMLTDNCQHTNNTETAWLQVDLLKTAVVTSIKIYNRKDCCSDRLQKASVFLSLDSTMSSGVSRCTVIDEITNERKIGDFHCSDFTTGRYVRLSMNNNFLHVCEMQVYGFYS